MDFIKGIFNVIADPRLYFLLMVLSLVFMVWKREVFTSKAVGYGLLIFLTLFFALGGIDPNFQLIITKPDNVPIVGLIFLLVFFTWYSMREAVLNDQRIAKGDGPIEKAESDRVWVWPDLVYTELISLILCSVVLIVWSILLKAPLEQPANRAVTPNPSKAPWYFLGLQEMLVYFDPWLAGVVLPSLIIVGPHRHSLHRQEPQGERLLHVRRAQGRDHPLPLRLRHPLVVAHRPGHVPARSELELLRAVRILGHAQARGADERRPVGVLLGADARRRAADELRRAGAARHPPVPDLRRGSSAVCWPNAVSRRTTTSSERRGSTSPCSCS